MTFHDEDDDWHPYDDLYFDDKPMKRNNNDNINFKLFLTASSFLVALMMGLFTMGTYLKAESEEYTKDQIKNVEKVSDTSLCAIKDELKRLSRSIEKQSVQVREDMKEIVNDNKHIKDLIYRHIRETRHNGGHGP